MHFLLARHLAHLIAAKTRVQDFKSGGLFEWFLQL